MFRHLAVAAVTFHAADDIVQKRGPDDAPGDELCLPDLGIGERQPSEIGTHPGDEEHHEDKVG